MISLPDSYPENEILNMGRMEAIPHKGSLLQLHNLKTTSLLENLNERSGCLFWFVKILWWKQIRQN